MENGLLEKKMLVLNKNPEIVPPNITKSEEKNIPDQLKS